jgi:hypothetical protein
LLRKLLDFPVDDPGQTLRRLWPMLPSVTVAEFKSIGRPYRSRGLDKLLSYIHAYFTDAESVKYREDLAGVLLVLNRTPTLEKDVAAMGLVFYDLGQGYWELRGGLFRLYVAEIDIVGKHERDGVLRSFGHHAERTPEALQFWAEQVGTKEAMMAVQELEGYDEVVTRFLELLPPEKRLAGLAPEERLAGLAPEERLAGLSREQILLGLPDDELRKLPEEYLATFPDPVRQAVHKRIGR